MSTVPNTTIEHLYFTHTLSPAHVDAATTPKLLSTLRLAITSASHCLESSTSTPGSDVSEHVYTGHAGIAWAYVRLRHQVPDAGLDYAALILKHRPQLDRHAPCAGKLAPLGTVTGPALVDACHQVLGVGGDAAVWARAMVTLEKAVRCACESREDGGDEVLYGRAGLLWGLMNFQRLRAGVGAAQSEYIDRPELVGALVDRIVEAGRRGREKHRELSEDMPLVWEWHEKLYLGAIHGAAGILTVLLQAPPDVTAPHMADILATVDALCRITRMNTATLPSSIPSRHNHRKLTQMCHGSPGLVVLLAALRESHPSRFTDYHHETLQKSAGKVWENGMVKKGLGICHGVAGNAWSLLMMARTCTAPGEKNLWLGRAIAMLLETREMKPLGNKEGYNLPDRPFSLFEGVAGTMAAYAEAYNVLAGNDDRILGYVGLGGRGITGFF